VHVGFKVAAKIGPRYLNLLEANEAIIARNVTVNLFDRHIAPYFSGAAPSSSSRRTNSGAHPRHVFVLAARWIEEVRIDGLLNIKEKAQRRVMTTQLLSLEAKPRWLPEAHRHWPRPQSWLADSGADVIATARRQQEVDQTADAVEARGRKTLRLVSDVCNRESLETLLTASLSASAKSTSSSTAPAKSSARHHLAP